MSPPNDGLRLIALFDAFSLIAVACGCWVAMSHGVPTSIWARNAAAWVVGMLAAAVLAKADPRLAAITLAFIAAAAIGATLLFEGLSGVHRWLVIGPVRLNAAQLFLPGFVVALAFVGGSRRWPWFAALILAALLALQPDASQATALAAAVLVALAVLRPRRLDALVAGAGSVIAAIVALVRPDPLQPVPAVEGIIGLALALSPFIAVVAVLALVGASLSPLLLVRTSDRRRLAAVLALTSYFVLVALAPLLAPFPVPLVGRGVSSILGGWLAIGLLAAASRVAGDSDGTHAG